jgi:hypothetical protein
MWRWRLFLERLELPDHLFLRLSNAAICNCRRSTARCCATTTSFNA